MLISLFAGQVLAAKPSAKPVHAPLPEDLENYLSQPAGQRNEIPPLPFQPDFTQLNTLTSQFKSTSLPISYDLRKLDQVSSVKSQGSELGAGGNCWAFTTLGAIESQWLKLGYDSVSLSAHSMSACHGFEWPYGDGGNDWLAMAYLTRLQGPILESQRPYTPDDYTSHSCQNEHSPLMYVPEVRWIPGNNKALLQYTLMHYGAVSVSMRWQTPSFNTADNTYLYSGNKEVNHAVLLSGWNDTLQTDVGQGAWIMKNQWGEGWADSGYFYIAYEDSRSNYTASYYPELVPPKRIDKIHYYDTLSALRSTGYQNSAGYALSRFIPDEEEMIHHIGTFIPAAGTKIDLAVYQSFSDDSLSGLLYEKQDIFHELPGFYTYPVQFSTSQDFYVRIRYSIPGNKAPIPIEIPIDDYAQPNLQGADGTNNPAYQTLLFKPFKKPVVRTAIPTDKARNVPLQTPYTLYFDKHIDSFNIKQITLQVEDSITHTPKQAYYSSDQHSLDITFDTLQHYGQGYKLIIHEGAFFASGEVNDADTLHYVLSDSLSFHPTDYTTYAKGIHSTNEQIQICMTDTIQALHDSLLEITRHFMVKNKSFSLAYSLPLSISTDNPTCLSANVPTSFYGETIRLYFQDSALISSKQQANAAFMMQFTPPFHRPLIKRSIPPDGSNFFHPDSQLVVEFSAPFDSINTSLINLVVSSSEEWKAARWDYTINATNNTLIIKPEKLLPGVRYNLDIKANALYFQNQPLNTRASLSFGTSGKYVWSPRNINLYETQTVDHGDSLFELQFSPAMYWTGSDTLLLINTSSGDSLKLAATLHQERILTFPSVSLSEGQTYQLQITEGQLQAKGNTWISPDGKSWSATGIGHQGHVFHTCIRAYADTGQSGKPYANFDVNARTTCLDSPIEFTDLSAGNITSYRWNFGEGATPETATGQGPHTVSYSNEGVKTIQLITGNEQGYDTALAHNWIQVKSDIQLQTENRELEIGVNETHSITLSGADEYEWLPTYWLDTNQGAQVIFESPIEGDFQYYIKGQQGGCHVFDSIRILVINRPVNQSVCQAIAVKPGVNGILNSETGQLAPFTNINATPEQGEPHPPGTNCNTQSSWCANVPMLTHSVWFTFLAPASGQISISTLDSYSGTQQYEFDTKIALYTADTCSNILSNQYTLLAANDDYHTAEHAYAAEIIMRDDLIPGKRYWIQVDGSFGGVEGDFYLTLRDGTTSIAISQADELFTLYPNPFTETLHIASARQISGDIHLSVYDMHGKKMDLKSATSGRQTQLNTEGWPKGLYLILIHAGNTPYQQVIVKE